MLGALMGTQIGVWTGTSGAQKIIRESGQEERIARSLKLAMERATAEIRANSEGIDVKNPLMMAGKAASPYGDLGTDNFDDSAAAPSHRDEQPSSSRKSHTLHCSA